MRAMRSPIWLLLAATVLSGAETALAGAPVALVTDVSGSVSPAVDLFQEVEAGTELTLGAGAVLTLEHYASCEAVTMTGGSVVVRENGLDLASAELAGSAENVCPELVVLASQDLVNAGVVMRGMVLPTVPLIPQIVVAGGGEGYDVMRVERDGREIASLPVRAGRVQWPDSGLFLSNQAFYVLVLTGPAGEHRARVVADKNADGRTVLRP